MCRLIQQSNAEMAMRVRFTATTKDAGVVDSNLRVFEAGNLYIAGSSVFPTNGWVNPTLSIIAISIRLANHLDKKLS